jgi:tetratricopeptide (TPR) repeat protein
MGEVSGALKEREIIQQHLHDVESPGEEPFPYAINYAAVLLRMDRPEDSMRALEGTLERARQSGNQIIVARTLLMRGSILVRLGRWDEAEAVSKEALALAVGEVGNKNFAAQAESLLAQVDLARGSLQSARIHSDKSLEFAGYHTNKPQRSLAATLLVAARLGQADHAFANAERFAQHSLAISESVARGPDTSADVGEGLLRLAQARIASGSRVGAKPLVERAVRCLSNGLDPNHPLTVEAQKLLASLAA